MVVETDQVVSKEAIVNLEKEEGIVKTSLLDVSGMV